MKTTITMRRIDVPIFDRLDDMPILNYPDHAFSCLMEGEALLDIEGKSYLLGAGQFLLIPQHKDIKVLHCENCKGYDGSFSIEALKDASYPILHTGTPLLQSFWFDDAVFLGSLLKRMYAAFQDKDRRFLQSGFDLILSQLRPGGKVAAIPEQFLQMVFDPKGMPLSVSDYAHMLNVTPNYLNKTVKQHTHRTAIDWIEIARLNKAKQLLKDRNIPVSEIAGRVGIPDQSYFSRFFKKKTGMTPSQYRSNL